MKHFFFQNFHLSVMFLRILGCCLMVACVFLLLKGIRLLRKSFYGPLLLEISFAQATGEFSLPQAGLYAIWQKGPLIRRTPVATIQPHIYEAITNRELSLTRSLSGKQTSDRRAKRIEIFTFSAPAGRYRMEIETDLPASKLDAFMEGVFPLPVHPADYFLQIRETQPGLWSLVGFFAVLLGALGIMAGLVLGILAEWLAGA